MPKEIHAILTETLACFLPGRAKDLSAPLYVLQRLDVPGKCMAPLTRNHSRGAAPRGTTGLTTMWGQNRPGVLGCFHSASRQTPEFHFFCPYTTRIFV